MKRTFFTLLFLASAGVTAHAQNLLKNPSYEDAGQSGDTAANWNRWGQWINREDSWSPTHSGKCLVGYHHWQIEKADNSGLWQDVTTGIKAGQKFKFSVFVSTDKPDNGVNSADKVELRLETIRNGKEVQIESVTTPVAELERASGWHELTITGTTPDNNIRVLVVVNPAAGEPRGGAVKIDDAKLELVK